MDSVLELTAIRRRADLQEWLGSWLSSQQGRAGIVSRLAEARILPMTDSSRSGQLAQAQAEAASFLARGLARSYRLQFIELEGPDLFLLQRRDGRSLVVDAQLPRFWLCHTLDETGTEEAAGWLDELLESSPALEPAWLPSQFLERAAAWGRWVEFDLAHGPQPGQPTPGSEAPLSAMRLQAGGEDVRGALGALRASGAFAHSLALTRVGMEVDDPEGYGTLRLELGYRGLLKGRGNYRLHERLAKRLARVYQAYVSILEGELSLGFLRQGRVLKLVGSPVNVAFQRRPSSLEALARTFFSGRAPLYLWGVPVELAPGFVRARVVDVQGRGRLSAELGESFLRLYVPRGSGGGLIARLYALLQQHYDSSATISAPGLDRLLDVRLPMTDPAGP